MGFRYRRSINLGGGFRVNISKSGIGYSWGVKGYRITKTARGTTRRTVSIPGTGISFVDETSKKKNRKLPSTPPQVVPSINANHYDTEEIVNGTAKNMISDGLEEILDTIKKSLLVNKISTIGIWVSLLLSFGTPLFFLALLGFVLLKIYIKKAGLVELDYTIDADQQNEVDQRANEMLKIANCNRVWRIMQTSKVIDKKYEAGASNTVKRIACVATTKAPFPFKTDAPVVTFKSGNETLIFLPDKLFILQRGAVGVLNYTDIQISTCATRFIENENVPHDAVVVDSTWQYVNKSGGPDKRFKNNRRLPICLYGEMNLKSTSGLNTVFMFSNPNTDCMGPKNFSSCTHTDHMWSKIISSYQSQPRDVRTQPLQKGGLWFYVWAEGNNLYVKNSMEHQPSCQIQEQRRLNPDECQAMYDLYKRRCHGEKVSQEATRITVNQVYWYGIFYDLECRSDM